MSRWVLVIDGPFLVYLVVP